MSVTLEQLAAWNGKVPLPEYEALLKKLEAAKKALARACETVYSEEDSLSVLADEKGSARWQKHEDKRRRAAARAEKLRAEIQNLEIALVGK